MFIVHVANKDIKTELGLKGVHSGKNNSIDISKNNTGFEIDANDNVMDKMETISKIDLFELVSIQSIRNLLDLLKF